MTYLNKLFASFFILVLILGCSKSERKSSLVVLKVKNETLTAQEFSQALTKKIRLYDAAAAKLGSNVSRAKDEIISSFILATIIKDYAKKNNISISDAEFEEEFNKIRKNYPSDLAFKESLAGQDLLFEEWKKSFIHSLLQKKVFSLVSKSMDLKRSASDLDEAKKYYQAHLTDYQKQPEAHIFQIFVNKQDEAEKIHKMIKSGAHTFEEMAKKYSQSPDAQKGGDIGFLAKGVVPAFDPAFNLNVGQLSGVIKSSYGYHIMKITAKKPASKLSFEQAKEEILKRGDQERAEMQFGHWINEQIKTVKVEKDTQLIENMKVQTEGP